MDISDSYPAYGLYLTFTMLIFEVAFVQVKFLCTFVTYPDSLILLHECWNKPPALFREKQFSWYKFDWILIQFPATNQLFWVYSTLFCLALPNFWAYWI